MKKSLMLDDMVKKSELGVSYQEDEFLKSVTAQHQRCIDVMMKLTDEKLGLAEEKIIH
jgi:hypothetical protein